MTKNTETLTRAHKAPRLFELFQPTHYDLSLHPDKTTLTFKGVVTIRGRKTGRPSQRITFHQSGLTIKEATITAHTKKGDHEITMSRIHTHKSYPEVRLHAEQMLYPGDYTITIAFEGAITKTMLGMYPSYFTHDGQEKLLIATQFESHYAREAFVCIDEPEAKATFALTLTTPKDDVVLSNTPSLTETVKGKLKTTVFETTPRMSTYLLAFVSGEMHAVEAKTTDGTLVRSWSSVAQPKKMLQYSLHEAVRVLEFFREYFGVAYPLAKCDQVALPDFDAGAMENWGLITYREIALLADPDNRSITTEQYVSMVIAHELSHQWFGNLVTMKWWDDLWLNESFASLMEHLALDAIHPDWQQWEHYVASDVLAAASRDVYQDIQSVGVELTDPELISTLFDTGIVYAKGGRLLKMLREHIGDEVFRMGLQKYFTTHAYKNATRADLWQALSDASQQDIGALMTPWLVKPGMPVVHATQKSKTLVLSQERFLLDADSESPAQDTSLWPIPLLMNVAASKNMLSQATDTFELKDDNYTLLNQFGSGHYFVHYTEAQHRAYIATELGNQTIATEARINNLNDMYMLSRRGDMSLVDALTVASKLEHEPRDTVWSLISRIVGAAQQLTEGDDKAEEHIKKLRIALGAHWYKKLGWDDAENDDPNTKQLRHTALAFMVAGEDKAAIQEAITRYKNTPRLDDVNAELRNTILGVAVRHGEPKIVARLVSEYPDASPDVQLDIVSALASTKDAAVAAYVLKKAFGPEGFVRAQDVLRWLAMFMRNRYTRDEAWKQLTLNWSWFEEVFAKSKSFDYLPTYCASVISTPVWAKKYRAFFEPKEHIKLIQRNVLLGYADIDARIAWRTRDEKKIKDWLNKNYT